MCSKEECFFKDSNVGFIVEYPITEDTTFVSIDEEKWNGKDISFKSIGERYLFNLNRDFLVVKKK